MKNIKNIAANLNKNVDVVGATFDKYNLQVISYGFCGINEDNGWMQMLIEVATKPGEELEDDISVKANFYDANNTIIFSYEDEIYAEDFSGYDTLHLYLNEDNLAFDTAKVRLYATIA